MASKVAAISTKTLVVRLK